METEPPVKKLKLMENECDSALPTDPVQKPASADLDASIDPFSDCSVDQEEHVDGANKQESPASVASRDDDEGSVVDDDTDEDVPIPGLSLADLTPKVPSIALPPVKPSPDHIVYYQFPWTAEVQPKPHPEKCNVHNVDLNEYVALPYYSKIKHKYKGELVPHWNVVKEALSKDIKGIEDLIEAIQLCGQNDLNCGLLEALLDEDSPFEGRYCQLQIDHFFDELLPGIKKLALKLPELVTKPIPYLKGGQSISLTNMQVASLMANAFFCTFPPRNRARHSLPDINFKGLFSMPRGDTSHADCNMEKLKCIFTYFRRMLSQETNGVITYHRRQIEDDHFPRWHKSEALIKKLCVTRTGTIEDDGKYMLQMDFANKYLGGGVLTQGCVQEEIRFIICPEFIAGCLFCKVMEDNEAIIICGAEQYCNYEGYGSEFTFGGHHKEYTPRDASGRRCISLVAIDAVPLYNNRSKQYLPKLMERELNKAYAGFFLDESCKPIPVASGNWGCGVFGGDPKLKSILQLMAASQCGRDLVYFTFRDKSLVQQLSEVHAMLMEKKATVGELYRMLLQFKSHGERRNRNVLEFLKENIGKTQLIRKFIKAEASPEKKCKEIKEDPVAEEACSSKNTSDAGPSSTIIEMPDTPPPGENLQPENFEMEKLDAAKNPPELEKVDKKPTVDTSKQIKSKEPRELKQTKILTFFNSSTK